MSETIIGQSQETEVSIQASQKHITYKTRVRFIDLNRKDEVIVSVLQPQVANSGLIQFTLADRVIAFPIMVIHRLETEQLCEMVPPQVVVSLKEKE